MFTTHELQMIRFMSCHWKFQYEAMAANGKKELDRRFAADQLPLIISIIAKVKK
jgi:hypothetical protein